MLRSRATWLLLCALAACVSAGARDSTHATEQAAAAPARAPVAHAWPEANALLRRDPRWLGADAALSVDLGGERTLWLFGDTFVAREDGAPTRAQATMVRNSIGVQRGRDPSRAEISFHWRTDSKGGPTSFFPDTSGGTWFWPGHGIRIGDTLTLFLHRIEASGTEAFGFRSSGWTAVRIDAPDTDPATWAPRELAVPDTHAHGVVGASVIAEGDHVYAFGVREPGDHAVWLMRWPQADFVAGDLTRPEYWGGPTPAFGEHTPTSVIEDGATEFSVSRSSRGRGLVQVQSHGFGIGAIALRFAATFAGPWSAPREAYRPEEAARAGVFCYAGKAHPELTGADLVVTYACNASDPALLFRDPELYYPRFLRVSIDP